MKRFPKWGAEPFLQIRNRRILLLFILFIAVLVGVRIMAENKKINLPSPVLISASGYGVAVSWGQMIYHLDHEGRVIGKKTLPEDIELSQLKLIEDEIWIADHNSKNVYRVVNGELRPVFSGSSIIRNAFKFCFNDSGDKIYVADSSNHKVHIFNREGNYQTSFGSEGKQQGQFKFPNSIVLTDEGNFLIVNTNALRLDIYSPEGVFVRTFAKVERIGQYEWPTLLARSGDKVALLLAKNDLMAGKLVVYDREGEYAGELMTAEPLLEPGDVTSWGDKVWVTDVKTRKVHLFDAATMSYIGEFSEELKALGDAQAQKEKRYSAISLTALFVLIIACLPLIYLFARQRRKEEKEISIVDINQVVPQDLIWASQINEQKLIISIILFSLMFFFIILLAVLQQAKNIILLLFVLLALTILSKYASKLFLASGYFYITRRKNIEKMLKKVLPKIRQALQRDEKVEGCTVLQASRLLRLYDLFIFTDRRILKFNFKINLNSFMPSKYSQLSYGKIEEVSLDAKAISSKIMARLIKVPMYEMRMSLMEKSSMKRQTYYLADKEILERVKSYLERKKSQRRWTDSFEDTLHAHVPFYAPAQAAEKSKWGASLLSVFFPGFGQLYNGQMLKGALFGAAACIFILVVAEPFRALIRKSAEISVESLFALVIIVFVFFVFYVFNIADAYDTAKRVSESK
ncbi:MAG TPA: hypothetical protein ENN23_00365 [Deltaproteobacteria bacterium]|nr:hypothetical protein [Deltaproteobacteria bacterium]